eukprot:766776_1
MEDIGCVHPFHVMLYAFLLCNLHRNHHMIAPNSAKTSAMTPRAEKGDRGQDPGQEIGQEDVIKEEVIREVVQDQDPTVEEVAQRVLIDTAIDIKGIHNRNHDHVQELALPPNKSNDHHHNQDHHPITNNSFNKNKHFVMSCSFNFALFFCFFCFAFVNFEFSETYYYTTKKKK